MSKAKLYIVLCFFSVLCMIGCMTQYPTMSVHLPAATDESFQRGKNLAFNICGQCHFNHELNKFAGKEMKDFPDFLGKVYSANLTTSVSHGVLSHYKDGELAYLLKTGIAHDGRYIPFMVRPNLAEEDIKDIIFYLRSTADATTPVDSNVGTTKVSRIGKLLMNVSEDPLPFVVGIKRPSNHDTIAMGRYLVDNIGCYHCHSASITSLNYMHPEESKGYMAGGMKFKNAEGEKVYGSNLTPDKETGIGNYTKLNFRKAVIEGIDPYGNELREPMHKYTHLTQEQADAIFSYLQLLTPVYNKVKKPVYPETEKLAKSN